MNLEDLLKELGAKDADEAVRMVSDAENFIGEVLSLAVRPGSSDAAKPKFADALAILREAITLRNDVEQVTGKGAKDAMGIVIAWKASHDTVPATELQLAEIDGKGKSAELTTAIAKGETDRKLTPAVAKLFADRAAPKPYPENATTAEKVVIARDNAQRAEQIHGELKAFLEVAPEVIPAPMSTPPTEATGRPGNGGGGGEGGQTTVDVGERNYEDLKPLEKQRLQKEDPQTFNALRADWQRRGQPAGYLARNTAPAHARSEGASARAGDTQARVNIGGRNYENLKPSEKQRLEKEDPAQFKALRADWKRRGEPAGYLARN